MQDRDGWVRRRATRVASVAVVGALVAGTSACASSSRSGGNGVTDKQAPADAVATAISNVGAQSSLKVAFSLPMSAADAEQLGSAGSRVTAAEAKALTTGSVFFSEATGHGEALDSTRAQTDSLDSFDLGLSFPSGTPIEIRYVDQNLFVLVQAQQLLTDTGQKPSDASSFGSEVSQLNTYVPGIGAVGQGKWVEATHAGLEGLAPAFKQITSSSGTNVAAVKADVLKLRTQVLSAIRANSTFTRTGTSGGRTEYQATVKVANVLQTLSSSVNAAFSDIPDIGKELSNGLSKAQASIPAGQTAVGDVYVAGDRVTEADVDLNQFEHRYSFAVPLQLTLSSPGKPAVPSGATVLDLSKAPALLQALLQGMQSSNSSSSSPTTGSS